MIYSPLPILFTDIDKMEFTLSHSFTRVSILYFKLDGFLFHYVNLSWFPSLRSLPSILIGSPKDDVTLQHVVEGGLSRRCPTDYGIGCCVVLLSLLNWVYCMTLCSVSYIFEFFFSQIFEMENVENKITQFKLVSFL